ncbi:hypothetical protein INT44_004627 [Umbelopsis vinacea]|uniref:Dimethylargininase n=1 Tax=Umbelopsis vinacea TaxID=44442 RepID=A0A8H7UNA5_9FUNG|nr:hypothetical protein INT44_004627 [Umbelopsis vinacea]
MISYAICRDLPQSFSNCVTAVDLSQSAIDITLAHQQHDEYVKVLKEHVANVIQVSADEAHPDCCFVEDTCVVVKDTAVINQLGHVSRQKEIGPNAEALKQVPTLKNIVYMKDMDEKATLDGGDCMLVDDHLYVGLSARTNEQGAKVLEKAFSSRCKVVTITALKDSPTLHLKCLVTQVNADTLVACSNPAGKELIQEIKQKSGVDYSVIFVPESVPANILALGSDFAVIQKNFPESERILVEELTEKRGIQLKALDMSELIKADGALTCCSVLIP